jgi:hypothetical protein
VSPLSAEPEAAGEAGLPSRKSSVLQKAGRWYLPPVAAIATGTALSMTRQDWAAIQPFASGLLLVALVVVPPGLGLVGLAGLGLASTWTPVEAPGVNLVYTFGPLAALGLWGILLLAGARGRVLEVVRALRLVPGMIAAALFVVSGALLSAVAYRDAPAAHAAFVLVPGYATILGASLVAGGPRVTLRWTRILLLLALLGMLAAFCLSWFGVSGSGPSEFVRGGMVMLRVTTAFGGSNDSAGLLGMLAPFGLAWLDKRRTPGLAKAAYLGLIAVCIFVSGTRMALIAAPVALCVYLLGSKRRTWALGLALGIAAFSMLSPWAAAMVADVTQTGGLAVGATNTLAGRVNGIWLLALRQVGGSAQALGVGFGPAALWVSSVWPRVDGQALLMHNIWMHVLYTRGLFGLALWIALTVAVGVALWRAPRVRPRDAIWRAAAGGAWAGYIVFGLTANASADLPFVVALAVMLTGWAASTAGSAGEPSVLSADVTAALGPSEPGQAISTTPGLRDGAAHVRGRTVTGAGS